MGIQQYAPVRQSDYEQSNSRTAVEEQHHRPPISSPLKTLSSLAAFLALGILVGFASSRFISWESWDKQNTSSLQDAFFPTFPRKPVTFTNQGDFTRSDEVGDQAWEELVPVGAGYLRVPHPQQYDLAPSWKLANDTEEAEIYQASVIHQLHCMATLRWYIRSYEQGTKPPHSAHLHVTHCIEYIRQAILCNADTTLEQGDDKGFNAEGAVHQCRDWGAVWAFLVEKRAGDEVPSILHT